VFLNSKVALDNVTFEFISLAKLAASSLLKFLPTLRSFMVFASSAAVAKLTRKAKYHR